VSVVLETVAFGRRALPPLVAFVTAAKSILIPFIEMMYLPRRVFLPQ